MPIEVFRLHAVISCFHRFLFGLREVSESLFHILLFLDGPMSQRFMKETLLGLLRLYDVVAQMPTFPFFLSGSPHSKVFQDATLASQEVD